MPAEQAAEAHALVGLDAFQAQEAEQVEAGHGEEDDPGGQEALAREDVPAAAPDRRWRDISGWRPGSTKPITTFTRASQPPLRGMRFRYDGKSASRKNGSARPVAKVTMPSKRPQSAAGDRCRQQRADERSDAGERREREGQAHEQRAERSRPFPTTDSSLVRMRRWNGDFEGAQQAQVRRRRRAAR